MIIRNKRGQFLTTRGNQSAKGNPPNKTSSGLGHTPFNATKCGTPRVLKHKRHGLEVITTHPKELVVRNSRGRDYVTKKRTSYARYLMNPPKHLIAYHKDGNPLNNNQSNLELITRAELLKRNRGCL